MDGAAGGQERRRELRRYQPSGHALPHVRRPRSHPAAHRHQRVLLFEPQDGDTLSPFWQFERGGADGGNLLIDFDLLTSETCQIAWKVFATGHVGFGRTGARGRLDLSADVPPKQALNLFPGQCYFFARVTIRSRHGELFGCRRPMRIQWVAARVRSTRPGSEELRVAHGPDQSVTWNAPRGGIKRHTTGLALETWLPRFAPPSWSAIGLPARLAAPAAADTMEYEK